MTPRMLRKSGLPNRANPLQTLAKEAHDPGQSYPQRCPPPNEAIIPALREPLGEALSIREAAHLIGCSPWTIRQKYLPAGLPHHRLSTQGKLIFYRNQIIRWLLREQEKGGSSS